MANKKVDLKCVLLGKAAVGKSCLVERFLHDRFTEMPISTVGAAFGAKPIKLAKRTVTLGIWDTAGGERYESMTRHYYKGAEAAVVCYDLTDATSFAKVKFWVGELLQVEENAIIALVGTKSDLLEEGKNRGISQAEVRGYARSINAREYETSARSNVNIDRVFQDITEEWDKRPKDKMDLHEYNPPLNLHSGNAAAAGDRGNGNRAADSTCKCG